jgi:hypothetical protein
VTDSLPKEKNFDKGVFKGKPLMMSKYMERKRILIKVFLKENLS